MKKKITAIIITGIMAMAAMTGCGNKQILDTTYSFERAIVSLPNGDVVEGAVTSWRDYDGDQIQVKINDVTYLVHGMNIALISE